jgi:hypothetical protein
MSFGGLDLKVLAGVALIIISAPKIGPPVLSLTLKTILCVTCG